MKVIEWTEEQNAILAELWTRGEKASYIAKIVGKTRNAVIGRAHRAGLAKRPSPIARKEDKKPVAPKKPLHGYYCLYPDGCNEPIHKRSYCEKHFNLCYVKGSEKHG